MAMTAQKYSGQFPQWGGVTSGLRFEPQARWDFQLTPDEVQVWRASLVRNTVGASRYGESALMVTTGWR